MYLRDFYLCVQALALKEGIQFSASTLDLAQRLGWEEGSKGTYDEKSVAERTEAGLPGFASFDKDPQGTCNVQVVRSVGYVYIQKKTIFTRGAWPYYICIYILPFEIVNGLLEHARKPRYLELIWKVITERCEILPICFGAKCHMLMYACILPIFFSVSAIQEAEHYIYVENQYVSSSLAGGGVENRLMEMIMVCLCLPIKCVCRISHLIYWNIRALGKNHWKSWKEWGISRHFPIATPRRPWRWASGK